MVARVHSMDSGERSRKNIPGKSFQLVRAAARAGAGKSHHENNFCRRHYVTERYQGGILFP